MNIESLIKLQHTWHTDKQIPLDCFSLAAMVGPSYLTVQILPKHHKIRLENIIEHHINWCEQNGGTALANLWQEVIQYMLQEDQTHELVEFNRMTTLLDNARKKSFRNTFPEFQDLL